MIFVRRAPWPVWQTEIPEKYYKDSAATLGVTAPEVNKTKVSLKRSQANPERLGCDISTIAVKQCGGEPDA
jgi:hypothetical protein